MSTLIITFDLDTAADKLRKRRSSRAGILQAQTSSYPNSLLFRTIPEQRYNIYDWQVTIQPRIQPNTPDIAEDSDPTFSAFRNPFARGVERPQISKPILRSEPFHRHSHTKDLGHSRPTTSSLISPSPSLRSQRSDISSQSSFLARSQGYPRHLPIQNPSNDLPSPASTLGYEEQFITGLTNAQGRSSTLSSHTRACSVSTSSTPPVVRETILDRAFNLNYIPGSDRVPSSDSGDGAMSSIARFEALMQEHERRKKAADASRPSTKEKDQWSLVEEGDSDTESSDPTSRATDQESVRENFFDDVTQDEDEDQNALDEIPLKAQRALEYIMSGRTSSSPAVISMRPKSSRSKSYNHFPPMPPPPTMPLPPMPMRRQRPMSFSHGHSRKASQDTEYAAQQSSLSPNHNLNRQSATSTKRLSFSELAKRLSSNSSLLLVQTNSRNSAVSSAASTYHDEDKENEEVSKGLSTSRLSGMNQGQAGAIRPGIGVRRSTVAAETQRYTTGGYGQVRHGQERIVPLSKGVWDDEGRCVQQWRGSGLFTGGEGGFL